MNKSGLVSAITLSLFVGLVSAPGTVRAQTSSPKPPTNLKLVGDHWTPWDPPEVGPEAYIIEKGDTLWDLAQRWLDDPYLWPQIWDENRYILDSHWIYPGDPLVIPGRPTVVPEEGPPPVTELPTDTSGGFGRTAEGQLAGEGAERVPETPEPPQLLPLAKATDLYCSGWIEPNEPEASVTVVRGEMEKYGQAEGDVVYLSAGSNEGVRPGDEFAVVRVLEPVIHPGSGLTLGTYMSRLGKARVMLTQEHASTAVIEVSCREILPGDHLVPWVEIPVPHAASLPRFARFDSRPSGGLTGQVVAFSEDVLVVGQGAVVHTDLGESSGLQPGDVLTVFRPNGDMPRMNLGQAVVLTVEPGTSTIKITRSVREMTIGDWAEVVE